MSERVYITGLNQWVRAQDVPAALVLAGVNIDGLDDANTDDQTGERIRRPCYVCGQPSTTQVSWPRNRVRWHWRCDLHWVDWKLFTHALELWLGHVDTKA